MNRLEKIEKAAQALVDGEKGTMDQITKWDNLIKALKPDIDWSNVPMGAEVTNGHGGDGMFIGLTTNGRAQVLMSRCVYDWEISDLTVELPKRTKLIKHPWPTDGKQPDWINDDTMVVTSYQFDGEDYQVQPGGCICFGDTNGRNWFAVLEDV